MVRPLVRACLEVNYPAVLYSRLGINSRITWRWVLGWKRRFHPKIQRLTSIKLIIHFNSSPNIRLYVLDVVLSTAVPLWFAIGNYSQLPSTGLNCADAIILVPLRPLDAVLHHREGEGEAGKDVNFLYTIHGQATGSTSGFLCPVSTIHFMRFAIQQPKYHN